MRKYRLVSLFIYEIAIGWFLFSQGINRSRIRELYEINNVFSKDFIEADSVFNERMKIIEEYIELKNRQKKIDNEYN